MRKWKSGLFEISNPPWPAQADAIRLLASFSSPGADLILIEPESADFILSQDEKLGCSCLANPFERLHFFVGKTDPAHVDSPSDRESSVYLFQISHVDPGTTKPELVQARGTHPSSTQERLPSTQPSCSWKQGELCYGSPRLLSRPAPSHATQSNADLSEIKGY
jgi:hypothetical protein